MTNKKKLDNLFLVGPMGAGKTTIGRFLASALKKEFYDSDQVIEERTGAEILWIYDLEGEDGFRHREIKVIDDLTKLDGIILATGGGTVTSPENRQALKKNGVVVYLKIALEDQMERTKRSKKRPLSSNHEERNKTLQVLRTKREPLYEEIADIICKTDKRSPRTVVTEIISKFKKYVESATNNSK
jgi:shikimate kinase